MTLDGWLILGMYVFPGLSVGVWLAYALTDPSERPPELKEAAAVAAGIVGWPVLLVVVVIGLLLNSLHEWRRRRFYGETLRSS